MTRSLAGPLESRRAVLRLLMAGMIGGLVTRLSLVEATEAKQKSKRQQKRQAERTPQDALNAEGKRKRKRPGKKNAKPRPAMRPDAT